jgi:hypothetical protein
MKRSSWVLEGDSLGVKYGVAAEFWRFGVHSRRGAGDIRERVLEPTALRDGVFFVGVTYGVDEGVRCEDRADRRGGVLGAL